MIASSSEHGQSIIEPQRGPATRAPAPATRPDQRAIPCDVGALYEVWSSVVRRWIRALGGPRLDAEDLTQEVFIVAQRKISGFDGANPAGWLYCIARHTVRDRRQRSAFRHLGMRALDVLVDEIASPTAARPDEQLERKQRAAHLYLTIGRLNPRWRASFFLFEVVGMSGEAIATLQRIPAATVRTHVARARKEIAVLLAGLSCTHAGPPPG